MLILVLMKVISQVGCFVSQHRISWNAGLFCNAICSWWPLLSYSGVPLSGHLCLLLFTHFTLQSPKPHVSQWREGLSGSSIPICTYFFLLFHSIFSLSSVVYWKYLKKTPPPGISFYYYIFTSPFSCFSAGFGVWKCACLSRAPSFRSLFLWIVLQSLFFLFAFIFFLYCVSRSIKAIRSQNSAR